MKFLEVILLLCGVVWCAAAVFFVYALGVSILTLSIQTFVTAVILFGLATSAELLLAILND